jgi:extradiol dioxygenase family protein
MTDTLQPFHLALPVTDLEAAEKFYCGLLGCGKACGNALEFKSFADKAQLFAH